jgi:hypothetical protein
MAAFCSYMAIYQSLSLEPKGTSAFWGVFRHKNHLEACPETKIGDADAHPIEHPCHSPHIRKPTEHARRPRGKTHEAENRKLRGN